MRGTHERRSSGVALLLVLALLALGMTGCGGADEGPRDIFWRWTATVPASVTSIYASADSGLLLIGGADGTLRRSDLAGAALWEIGHPGLSVTALSADPLGTTIAAVAGTPQAAEPAVTQLNIYGADGAFRWQVLAPVAGQPVGTLVSGDGTKVLVWTPSAGGTLASVSVRDSVNGATRWSKQTEGATALSCDGSADLRRVVVGYAITVDDDDPTGLVEAYTDDSLKTDEEFRTPTYPSLITTDVVGLAEEKGRLSAYELSKDGMGDRLWRKTAGGPGALVQSGGGRIVVASYDEKGSGKNAMQVTTISVRSKDGSKVWEEAFEGAQRFVPVLSADGRYLALVPARSGGDDIPLVVQLAEKPIVAELPKGVTAVHFGAGEGLMAVGMADGTFGIAQLPF